MATTRDTHQQRLKEGAAWLGRFGYLRAKDLGRLVFNDSAAPATADRLGRRLAKALRDDGLALAQEGPGGASFLALSERGARLASGYTGETYRSGKDLLRNIGGHRLAANELAVRALRVGKSSGVAVITEREIQTSTDRHMLANKIPDLLVVEDYEICPGEVRKDYAWVEVENCKRGGRDLQKLAAWTLWEAFPDHKRGYMRRYKDGYFDTLVLAISVPEARTIKGRLLRELERQAQGDEFAVEWVKDKAPKVIKVIDLTTEEPWWS